MIRIGRALRRLFEQLILWGVLVIICLALLGLFGSTGGQNIPAELPGVQVVVTRPAVAPPLPSEDLEDFVRISLLHQCTDRAEVARETGYASSARIGGPVCNP